jgi:hypothetical protein
VNLQGAACAGEDPDIFFPTKISPETLQRAQLICKGCPVIVQCGLYAEKTHVSDGGLGWAVAAAVAHAPIPDRQNSMSGENLFKDCDGIEELVGQLVGAGSTCWTNLDGAGEFDGSLGKRFAEDGVKRLSQILGGQ